MSNTLPPNAIILNGAWMKSIKAVVVLFFTVIIPAVAWSSYRLAMVESRVEANSEVRHRVDRFLSQGELHTKEDDHVARSEDRKWVDNRLAADRAERLVFEADTRGRLQKLEAGVNTLLERTRPR